MSNIQAQGFWIAEHSSKEHRGHDDWSAHLMKSTKSCEAKGLTKSDPQSSGDSNQENPHTQAGMI
jgi:hypothetical protein